MTSRLRAGAPDIAVGALFAGAAAAAFALGDERGGSLSFFLAWLAVHALYGIVSGSFWVLVIVLTCPPLLIAAFRPDGDETPLWLEAAFVEAFYGVPLAFLGILAGRLWQIRRRPELAGRSAREESSE